uniref:Uncharacterized protein n=1 Tax=Arundo donax TaxID=35708 RepID=A0A0A9GHH0_ARUDO
MRRSGVMQGKMVARSAWVGRGEASLEVQRAAAGGAEEGGAELVAVRRLAGGC